MEEKNTKVNNPLKVHLQKEKIIIGAFADCLKTKLSVMVLTKVQIWLP